MNPISTTLSLINEEQQDKKFISKTYTKRKLENLNKIKRLKTALVTQ